MRCRVAEQRGFKMLQAASEQETKAPFSHREYRQILKRIGPNLKDYPEAARADAFTILRHDVEFSVARAHTMGQIEQAQGIASTFFFQVCSSAYNPFSVRNRTLIHQIGDLGHRIGLHLYVSHVAKGAWDQLEAELRMQKQIFEAGLGLDCERFSFHRPPGWVLENRDDEIGGLLNTYGKSFFEFSDQPSRIKYIADSKHKWPYGHPLDDFAHCKAQILIHPDEWSEQGGDTKNNFGALIDENRAGFIETLDEETQVFSLHREELT